MLQTMPLVATQPQNHKHVHASIICSQNGLSPRIHCIPQRIAMSTQLLHAGKKLLTCTGQGSYMCTGEVNSAPDNAPGCTAPKPKKKCIHQFCYDVAAASICTPPACTTAGTPLAALAQPDASACAHALKLQHPPRLQLQTTCHTNAIITSTDTYTAAHQCKL